MQASQLLHHCGIQLPTPHYVPVLKCLVVLLDAIEQLSSTSSPEVNLMSSHCVSEGD